MPFDAAVALSRPETLQDVLNAARVEPVSWELLTEHKEDQLRRFGPSFWYRHQAVISVALIIASPAFGAAVAASHGFLPHWNSISIGFSFAWMCLVALITGTGLIRVRAGARWEERWVLPRMLEATGVPRSIAETARSLQREMPGSVLILGELKQEHAVLDPYLLIEYGDECACLGIWDTGVIVASASKV